MSASWENDDGSTNVDGFLATYAKDDNTFWRAEIVHVMNVLDMLIERMNRAEAMILRLGSMEAFTVGRDVRTYEDEELMARIEPAKAGTDERLDAIRQELRAGTYISDPDVTVEDIGFLLDRLEEASAREEESIRTSIVQQNAGGGWSGPIRRKSLQGQMDLKQAEDLLRWVQRDRPSAHSDRLWEAINRFINRKELQRGDGGTKP
jgi:hypothetical protein